MQDRVDDPEPPVMLVEERLHVRLVELVVVDRVTVPVKPLSEATVIVEVAATPAFAVTVVGLAVIPKSGALVTWYVTATECDRVLLVPVTVAR